MKEGGAFARMEALEEGGATKTQLRMIDYFRASSGMEKCSLPKLAKKLDVAVMTVLRFCRALGYSGYRELCCAIEQESEGQTSDMGCLDSLTSAYAQTIALCAEQMEEGALRRAGELLLGADSVCCCAFGVSRHAAREMHSRLLALGIRSVYEGDAALIRTLLSSFGEGDVLLLFEGEGGRETTDAAVLARANGMKIVAVGCAPASPLSRYADAVLAARGRGDADRRLADLFCQDALALAISEGNRQRKTPPHPPLESRRRA